MTNEERKYLGRVAELGCILCRHKGIPDSPAEIHHIRTGTGAGRRASHFDTLPLCPAHHRNGNEALHTMGRKSWEAHHGVTELELLETVKSALAGRQQTREVIQMAKKPKAPPKPKGRGKC